MYRLEWDDALATGDAHVDSQHRALFLLVRELADIVEAGGDRDRMEDPLYELLRYAGMHFQDEERLMARIGFPDLDRQRRLHDSFRVTATEMAEDYLAGELDAQELLRTLTDWLHVHVAEEDGRIADFVRGTRD